MREIDRIIRKTRIRLTLADFLFRAGRWLVVGVAVSMLLILLDRLTAVAVSDSVLLVAPVMAVLLSGWLAWQHRPGAITAAARLDHELGLKDRIGSAAALDKSIPWKEPFAELVRHDAESIAPLARARLREATKFPWTNAWSGVIVLALAAGGSWWLLPEVDLFPRQGFNAGERERIAQAEMAAETALREAAEALRRTDRDSADAIAGESVDGDESTSEVLETLDRLSSQLAAGEANETPDPRRADEALAEAADEIESLAESMASRADAAEQAERQLAEELAKIEPRQTGAADELTDALRNADFDRAAREAQRLNERLSALTDEERKALADQLRDLSEQVESAPAEAREERRLEEETDQGLLTDQGVDPEVAEQLASEDFKREEVKQALVESGVDEQTARDLSEELEERARQRNEQEETEERLTDTARDLEDLGRTIDPDAPNTPIDTPTSDVEGPESEPRSDTPESPQPKPEPTTGEGEPEPEPGEGPKEIEPPISDPPGTGPKNTDETPPPTPPGNETGNPPPPETGGDKPVGKPETGTEPPTDPDTTGDDPTGIEDGSQDPPSGSQEQPGTGPTQGTTPQTGPSPTPGSEPGTEPGTEPAAPRTAEDIIESISRRLDEVERTRDRIARDREESERLRKEAEKLLDRLSPEEREKLERWANEYVRERMQEDKGLTDPGEDANADEIGPRRERDPAYEIEDVNPDRPQGEAQDAEVIAEWFNDEPHGRDDRVGRTLPPRERARRAAEAIERALNDEAIAPRYRTLIRNWARRLREQQLTGSSSEKATAEESGSAVENNNP